ncbi:hypothetical protein RND81_06G223600 [Saponaria officinalis]
MGTVIGEEKHLENGDSSPSTPPPKYMRRKVSAVRDFPRGCGPNVTLSCKPTKGKEVQGVDGVNVDDVLKEVLKDIETSGEKDEDLCKSESKELLEQTVQPGCLNVAEFEASTSASCGKVKCGNEELQNHPAENTSTLKVNQDSEEEPVLRDEKHNSSDDLMEVRRDFPTTIIDSSVDEPKEIADAPNDKMEEKGTHVEQHLLPHLPIPQNIFRKERKYPPPRRVSAVRTFPAGCGRNVKSLGHYRVNDGKSDTKMQEKDVLSHNEGNLEGNLNCEDKMQSVDPRNSGNAHEKISESDEGVAPSLGQSSEIEGREENLEDNINEKHTQDMEQVGYHGKDDMKKKSVVVSINNDGEQRMQDTERVGDHGKDEMGIESLPDWLEDDVVVYEKDKKKKKKTAGVSISNNELHEESIPDLEIEKRNIVQGLRCAASCPWRQVKGPAKPSPSRGSAKESKGNKRSYDAQDKQKRPLTKSKDSAEKVAEKSMMIVPYINEMETNEVSRPLAVGDDEDSSENEEHNDFQFIPRPRYCDVTLPPSIAGSSSEGGSRSKVRETLRLFQVLVRKILQGEETKPKEKGKAGKRVDLIAAKMLKEKGKYINTEKVIGPIPGVEIGDIFSYRIELAIIGLHGPLQGGIDTVKQGKLSFATSVVASGGYDNDVDSSDVVIYTGQGGNPTGPNKQHEDQKLEKGNLALKNCFDKKSPVRVVRGFKESKSSDSGDGRSKTVATYTYDGLYIVEKYWPERGSHGTIVYKFMLKRIPGQRQLAWRELKQSKKCKVREGCCVNDISEGKEKTRICAVNTVDDEKPPPFTYITSMMYPDWCRPIPPMGCDCKNGCSDSDHCKCAIKNGGEIPYNLSGAIVEAKPLVYECGPSCKCPPSCSNRVSQHGIKLTLEIFKTESRGWGVRCLSSIPAGSFICEYIGEMLDDKEAEQRVGSDEYLFDIGQCYNDTGLSDGLSAIMPDMTSITTHLVENVGFTIDAARYGNIGRFINHSCTPNLYAQNVLYDHEDKRIPHIMMFAAENIPPLQELTYHYNYAIDQVFDSEGNVKRKDCYCGSAECTGRMY